VNFCVGTSFLPFTVHLVRLTQKFRSALNFKQFSQFSDSDRSASGTKGAALLIFVILFLVTSLILVLSISEGVYRDLAGYRTLYEGKQSFYGAEAGIEDAIHRHRQGMNYTNLESFSFAGVDVEVNRSASVDFLEFLSEGDVGGAIRTSTLELALGDGTSFNFGLQSGNGGITLQNTSAVVGNVFSNGSVEGSGNMIYGNVVSAGSSGLIDSIHATGSVWAHSIDNSTVDDDAYYYATSTITATVVGGTRFPGSVDQTVTPLPITDAQVEDWKQDIIDTGTVIASTDPECSGGTYIIDTNTTLDNVRIQCNVEMKKQGASTVITLEGPVWIEGNLSFTSGPDIVASTSLGIKSVQIIVDKEDNRATSSKITVNNSTNFTSGHPQ